MLLPGRGDRPTTAHFPPQHVYRISYNFKSCVQNLNLHVNHKILITASEVSSSGHEDPLSSLENATLKIRTIFCSSGAV